MYSQPHIDHRIQEEDEYRSNVTEWYNAFIAEKTQSSEKHDRDFNEIIVPTPLLS
jgi:hypothetical protein